MAGTRDDIIRAARELFCERGYDGVSVRDIATHADVNVAAVSYHFGGKEALFKEVVRVGMDQGREELVAAFSGEGTTREKLDEAMRHFLYYLLDDDSISPIIFSELAIRSQRITDIMFDHLIENFQLMTQILKQGVEKGEIRETDETITILNMVSTPIYLTFAQPFVEILRGRQGYSKQFLKKMGEHSIDLFFKGLEPRSEDDA